MEGTKPSVPVNGTFRGARLPVLEEPAGTPRRRRVSAQARAGRRTLTAAVVLAALLTGAAILWKGKRTSGDKKQTRGSSAVLPPEPESKVRSSADNRVRLSDADTPLEVNPPPRPTLVQWEDMAGGPEAAYKFTNEVCPVIGRLLGDDYYPLFQTYEGELRTWYGTQPVRVYRGLLYDTFLVTPDGKQVLRADASSQRYNAFQMPESPDYHRVRIPFKVARAKAEAMARELAPWLDLPSALETPVRLREDCLTIAWRARDSATGALLPSRVSLGLDPVSDLVLWWQAEHNPVKGPFVFTRKDAEVQEAARREARVGGSVNVSVQRVLDLDSKGRTVLHWLAAAGEREAFIIDDATGQVLKRFDRKQVLDLLQRGEVAPEKRVP